MTSDTVAGERPRCSARYFRLTDGAEEFPRSREDVTIFDRGMRRFVGVVWHNREERASINADFSASEKTIFVHVAGQKAKKNRFSMD